MFKIKTKTNLIHKTTFQRTGMYYVSSFKFFVVNKELSICVFNDATY